MDGQIDAQTIMKLWEPSQLGVQKQKQKKTHLKNESKKGKKEWQLDGLITRTQLTPGSEAATGGVL